MATSSGKLWKCPRCGLPFAKRNQWHSCRAQPVERHFRRKNPVLRQIYRRLLAALRKFGPLRVDAVQTSINLVSTHHFGGLTVRRDYLRLGFLSDRVIDDPRIVRREPLGPNRIGHSVLLRTSSDVDAQLLAWLRRAYTLQAR